VLPLKARSNTVMKNFILGFLLSLSMCLIVYVVWENYRHVPVVIQQVPVPVPVKNFSPTQQDPIALQTKENYNATV
jgi:hypothetical protein